MKITLRIFITAILIASGIGASAQMDNLANLSAEWIRTGARNAAMDATDIVVYNPAATCRLSDGFHAQISNQTLFRKPTHSYDLGIGQGQHTYSQYGSDPFLPNFYAAYKKNRMAVFTGLYVAGGGATMNYPTGSITTDLIANQVLMSAGGAYGEMSDQHLKATSYYMTSTLGASYAANDFLSFSAAIRYINAKNTVNAGMTMTSSPFDLPDETLELKTEDHASGISAVFGININPSEDLNLSLRYESNTSLEFKTKQITDDFGLTTDGELHHRDLPALLAFGAGIKLNTHLRSFVDFNYYFQTLADWGTSGAATQNKKWSSMAGDAYTFGLGFRYEINPKFSASLGGGYTDYAYNDKDGYYTSLGTYEVIQDDNVNLNTGIAFRATQHITVNAGYMHTFWAKDNTVKALNAQPLDVDVKINNSLHALALGVDFAF